jgi:hypothetical protein
MAMATLRKGKLSNALTGHPILRHTLAAAECEIAPMWAFAGEPADTTAHRDAALWLRTGLAAAVFNP